MIGRVFVDFVGLAGVGSLGWGLWLIYPPAMFVTLGILALVFAALASRPRG